MEGEGEGLDVGAGERRTGERMSAGWCWRHLLQQVIEVQAY